MKTKTKIRKLALLLLLGHLIITNAFSQDSYLKNRWNIKAGYSRQLKYTPYGGYYYFESNRISNLRFEINYGITDYLETGIYAGLSLMEIPIVTRIDTGNVHSMSASYDMFVTPFYGLTFNFHLLPFLIKQNDFRFDLYATGKYGGLFTTSKEEYDLHGFVTEYGIGGGLSFYPWKHLGFYTEYCFGKFFFEDNKNFRYGLTIKF